MHNGPHLRDPLAILRDADCEVPARLDARRCQRVRTLGLSVGVIALIGAVMLAVDHRQSAAILSLGAGLCAACAYFKRGPGSVYNGLRPYLVSAAILVLAGASLVGQREHETLSATQSETWMWAIAWMVVVSASVFALFPANLARALGGTLIASAWIGFLLGGFAALPAEIAAFGPFPLVGVALALALVWHNDVKNLQQAAYDREIRLREAADMQRNVLEFVRQGLLVVDLDGTISPLRAGCVESWLGPLPDAPIRLWDYVEAHAPGLAERWAVLWPRWQDQSIQRKRLMWAANQLPQRQEVSGRTLKFDYWPVEREGKLAHILIGFVDITDSLQAIEASEEQQELVQMLGQLATDAGAVRNFFCETQSELQRLIAENHPERQRAGLFTLGADFSAAGLVRLASGARKLEHALIGRHQALAPEEFRRLEQRWQALSRKLLPVLLQNDDRLVIDLDEYHAVLSWFRRQAHFADVADVMSRWMHEPLARPLARLALHAQSLAVSHERGVLAVQIDSGGCRLPADVFRTCWPPLAEFVKWTVVSILPRTNVDASEAATSLCLHTTYLDQGVRLEWRIAGSFVREPRVRREIEDPFQDLAAYLMAPPVDANDNFSWAPLMDVLKTMQGRLDVEVVHPAEVRLACTWKVKVPNHQLNATKSRSEPAANVA
jgi:hypothetical protein